MNNKYSKTKSFFQRLTESFISILPLSSSLKKEDKNIAKSDDFSTTKNTRFASEVFSEFDDNIIKSKRPKLHHDPMTLPQTRILRASTPIIFDKQQTTHLNDAASDISDHSNASISTSGVSSLHPRTNKRFNLNFLNTPAKEVSINLPDISHNFLKDNSYQRNKSSLLLSDTFISANARKILDNLDRITTPVNAGDTLFASTSKLFPKANVVPSLKYKPYARNNPSTTIRNPIPTKAVTVSASSNFTSLGPLRRKQTCKSQRKLGYCEDDNVDLDIYKVIDDVIPTLGESTKINLSHMPLLKVSRYTNTEEEFCHESPTLNFDFGAPSTINANGYVVNNDGDDEEVDVSNVVATNKYTFKRIIQQDENQSIKENRHNSTILGLWRCNTCFTENRVNTIVCRSCSNLSSSNNDQIALTEITKMNKNVYIPEVSKNSSNGLTLVESSIVTASQVSGIAPLSSTSFAFGLSYSSPPVSSLSFGMSVSTSANVSQASTLGTSVMPHMPLTMPPPITSLPIGLHSSMPPMSFGVPPPLMPPPPYGILSTIPPPPFGILPSLPPPQFGGSLSFPPQSFGVVSSTSSNILASNKFPDSFGSSSSNSLLTVPSINFGANASDMFNDSQPTFTFGKNVEAANNLASSISNPCFGSTIGHFDPTVAPPSYNSVLVSSNPFNASSSVPGSMDRMSSANSLASGQRKFLRSRRKR